jgi:acyl carrier protein phosphodiesterase
MAQDTGRTGGSGTAATPDAMQREIDALAARLDVLRATQSKARTQTLIVVLIIIVMFLVFMGATWSRISGNFNQVAIEKSMKDRSQVILPQAKDRLIKAAKAAAPTYRDLAMARMREAGPQIAAEARARLDKVPQENGEVLHTELQTTFDRVATRVDPDISAAFPSLTDDRKKAILADFHKDVDEENQKIKAHVDQIWTNEMVKMHAAISKFEVALAPGQQQDQAEREFLHALVMYVDSIITQTAPPAAPPSNSKDAVPAAATAPPATQASTN